MSFQNLLIVSLFLFTFSTGFTAELNETLSSSWAESTLDELSGTKSSLNHVELLHLGKSSFPKRMQLIKEAQHHVFVSVPYWQGDETGSIIFEAFEDLSKSRDIDLRFLRDWTSKISSEDPLKLKVYKKLKLISHRQSMAYNPPWGRRWTADFVKNRLHEKVFIVDGRHLIMGGMNFGDGYFQGGVSEKGWHDTDVYIQGPAVNVASEFFVKTWEIQKHLKSSAYFPPYVKWEVPLFLDYYYKNIFDFSYIDWNLPNQKPLKIQNDIHFSSQETLSDPKYLPQLEDGDTSVRMVYDNPLVDRDRNTYKNVSRSLGIIRFLLSQTKKNVRIFYPYPTMSEDFEDLLVQTAQRGIKIEMLTNSWYSHDIGHPPYYAGLSHYERLTENGIRIFEWVGHRLLKDLESENSCIIPGPLWPGRTVHTKAMVFDDAVAYIGSHNFNVRSERLNTEVMALVNSEEFAKELASIFISDLDLNPNRTIRCGEKTLDRPQRAHEIDFERAKQLTEFYKDEVNFWKNFQSFL